MNSEITKQFDHLQKLQRQKERARQPFLKYAKVNCGAIIESVHQQYKAMAYSLRRIVCNEDEVHI
jgi:hypothetical protein